MNRVVIITGANSGLGFHTAKTLCKEGNDVILACRNNERGNGAVSQIKKEQPDAKATFMQLDLASQTSIRQFAEKFHSTGKKLHVLINNAGIWTEQRQVTEENFEVTMGTNHLGHFLLTHLLLDDLKSVASETGEARIVVVSGTLHDRKWCIKLNNGKPTDLIDMDNFQLEKPGTYTGLQAYKNSKVANILFCYELSERLKGTGITVNCLCPGFLPDANLMFKGWLSKFMVKYVFGYFNGLNKLYRTLDQGTAAVVDLAVSEERKGVTGRYFFDRKETPSAEETYDKDLQKAVWDKSMELCELNTKGTIP